MLHGCVQVWADVNIKRLCAALKTVSIFSVRLAPMNTEHRTIFIATVLTETYSSLIKAEERQQSALSCSVIRKASLTQVSQQTVDVLQRLSHSGSRLSGVVQSCSSSRSGLQTKHFNHWLCPSVCVGRSIQIYSKVPKLQCYKWSPAHVTSVNIWV